MLASRWASFFIVGALTTAWGLVLLGFGVFFGSCLTFSDRRSDDVVVWSAAEGVKHVTPLAHAYGEVSPTVGIDGRVFLTTTRTDTSPSRVERWEWDGRKSRFRSVPAIPAPALPPGLDASGRTVHYLRSGRVLVTPKSVGASDATMLYEHGWRQIDPVAPELGPFFEVVDMSDGALLAVVFEIDGTRSALLEAGTTTWHAAKPPADPTGPTQSSSVSPTANWRPFAAPDGKVALLDWVQPSRLWDPRTGVAVKLSGPPALRHGAAAVSLDGAHVVVAGGQATTMSWSWSLVLQAGALVGWMALGAFGARRVIRMSRATAEETAVRRYALWALGLAMVPTLLAFSLALAVFLFVNVFGIPMGRM